MCEPFLLLLKEMNPAELLTRSAVEDTYYLVTAFLLHMFKSAFYAYVDSNVSPNTH